MQVTYSSFNGFAWPIKASSIRNFSFPIPKKEKKQINYTLSMKSMDNLKKLNKIAGLKDDWNLHGASSFSESLIEFCRNMLLKLNRQPDIFPTANDSIQFEFENNGDYLEIEIYDDLSRIEYYMKKGGKEIEKSAFVQDLIQVVDTFYE